MTMYGIFALMSKPSKNGRRKYLYENRNTHEYSFNKVDGVEYTESKCVYQFTDMLKREIEMYNGFTVLKNPWKEII